MAFKLPPVQPDLAELITSLTNSKLQIKDNALYQTVYQIIQRIGRSRDLIIKDIQEIIDELNEIEDVTFLTVDDESGLLPNSRRLEAGDGITFDDSIINIRTISADIEAIALLLASRRNVVKILDIDLQFGVINGRIIVNGDFEIEEIGPVIVFQSPTKESEFGIITFAAEILDTKRMKLIWFAPFGAPRKTIINYISSTENLLSGLGFGNIVPADHGGTGQSAFTIGDLLYADTIETLDLLNDVSIGSYLRSGGLNTAPLWSTLKLLNTISQGSILFADALDNIIELAKDTNATRYLSNTGVSNNPAWAQIALATGVSGVLPTANGGTSVDIASAALPLGSGQITFPATQNPSSNVNTLDDYEEGDWTPVIGGTGGESGQSYSGQVGRYVKIGKVVTLTFNVILSVEGVITTNVVLKGLPFTLSGDAAAVPIYWNALITTWVNVIGLAPGGSATLLVRGAAVAATTTGVSLTAADIGNTTQFVGAITVYI